MEAQVSLTVGAFPLPSKLRKLKLRIENTPNGNASISQKLPYIAKTFLRSHEVVFQAIRKRNNLQNCNETVFFSHLQVTWHM